jgi:hypothetical protein
MREFEQSPAFSGTTELCGQEWEFKLPCLKPK